MFIMSLMHMMEMEQLIRSYLKKPPVKGGKLQMDQDQIKMRYGFAMCAFATTGQDLELTWWPLFRAVDIPSLPKKERVAW